MKIKNFILIFTMLFIFSSCEEEGDFKPNNLISVGDDIAAEEALANLTGAPYIQSVILNSRGTFGVGDIIILSAKFSKRTKFGTPGIPRIPMNIGGVTRYATYTGGSESASYIFTFAYTVQAGDLDHDGIELVFPWELNGSTVEDYADQDAELTYTPPNLSGWNIDTANLTASFDDGSITNDGTPGITLSASTGSVMYLGSGCVSGGADVPYATTLNATIGSTNAVNTFYLAVGNGSGGYSACRTLTITHDNQNPNTVAGIANSSNSSDIESDEATWLAVTDNGPAGISNYEVAVSTTNNVGGIVANGGWTSVGNNLSGSVSNGATPFLTVLTDYYSLIKAVDNAGNESAVAASPSWQLAALSPEQITSMSVVNSTDESLKVGWPYPSDNGFSITDYIIQYRLNGDTTWITINDGVSTTRRYELTGLDPETEYDFRVRAYNGTNFGAWAPTLVAETLPTIDFISTPYSAINVGGATLNQLVSLDDDNEIYYGTNSASSFNDGTLISADLDRGKTISVPANDFTVVVATKPFFIAGRLGSGSDTTKANVVWQTSSWIGKSFIFSHSRSNPMKVKVYAFTNSTVTITKNGAAVAGGVQAITAESGHVFTISSYGSYEINSTGFIMVYGYANQGGTRYVDPKPFLPASNDLIGIPSRTGQFSTATAGTTYTNYHSNGADASNTMTPGTTRAISSTGTRNTYQDNAMRIRSNHPIVGNSYADANGSCSAPLAPSAFQKTRFAINVQAEWVAMASTNELVVTAYEPTANGLGFEAPRTFTMTRTGGNNNTPTKQYSALDFRAGTIFEGTAPFQMYYEPKNDTNGADNDETIMFGWD